jgi:hypothetical protein
VEWFGLLQELGDTSAKHKLAKPTCLIRTHFNRIDADYFGMAITIKGTYSETGSVERSAPFSVG